jgi:signal transduction histidine kinase
MQKIKSAKLYIRLALIVIILGFMGVVSNYYFQKISIEKQSLSHIPNYEKRFKDYVDSEASKISSYLEFIKEKRSLQKLFIDNNNDELYKQCQGIYQHLNKNGDITHFYFIKPDGEILLRVHDKDRHSDIIKRHTFIKSKENNSTFYGLEFGLKKNYTLRIVHPWIVDGKIIGYVELGKEVDKIIESLSTQLNIEIYFAVDKSVFKNAPKFVKSKLEKAHTIDSSYIVYKSNNIPKNISKLLKENSMQWVDLDGNNYISHNDILKDVSGKKLGKILYLVNVTKEYDEFIISLYRYGMIMAIGTALMLLIGVFFARQSQKKINATLERLERSKVEAEQANSAKSQFLANMSHEIRTPMNAILGFVDILSKTEKDEKRIQKFNIIKKSSKTLLNIINDILDISKIEAGEIIIDSQKNDINSIYLEVVNLFKESAESKNVNFLHSIDSDIPTCIYVDDIRLKQILFNLLSNAIKFTDKDGTVELNISYISEKKYILFEVTDTGIGISSENLTKIFDAFIQEDSSTTRKYGGTGLGLAIASKLVSMMGGTLHVESVVNEGTKFFFELHIKEC